MSDPTFDPSVPLSARVAALHSELELGSRGGEVQAVQEYLAQFGYLPNDALAEQYPSWRPFVADTPSLGVYDSVTARAVQAYQSFMGLEQTGGVNEAVRKSMRMPRCGVPDSAAGTSISGETVDKFSLNLNTNGVPESWTRGVTVSWKMTNATSNVFPAVNPALATTTWGAYNGLLRDAARSAFDQWSSATTINFGEATGSSTANIMIRWDEFDNASPPLGRTELPNEDFNGNGVLDLRIGTNSNFTWFRDNTSGVAIGANDTDLRSVVLHEVGHAIGLRHSSVSDGDATNEGFVDAVMQPGLAPGVRALDLHVDDMVAVSTLYDTWEHVPGKATGIDVGGDFSVWILGSSGSTSGERIYQRVGNSWAYTRNNAGASDEKLATRIAVARNGVPWIVDGSGTVFRRTTNTASSGSWTAVAAAQCATDIDIGYDGSVWIIGCDQNLGIRKLSVSATQSVTGATWSVPIGSRVRRIAVDSDGIPWVVNKDNDNILRRTTNNPGSGAWELLPGKARDIAAGPTYLSYDDIDGSPTLPGTRTSYVYVVDNFSVTGGYHLHVWNEQAAIVDGNSELSADGGSRWVQIDGHAEEISVGPIGEPWAINSSKDIFRRAK